MAKLQKTWGDIFRAALRRGCDHGYAGWLADKYEKRKMVMAKFHQRVKKSGG